MGRIVINGVLIDVADDSSISIRDGVVKVNGGLINVQHSGDIKVTLEGTVSSLDVTGSVTVNGTVQGNVDCGGSFQGKDVEGSVNCGGSFSGGTVGGDVNAGGSVSMRR